MLCLESLNKALQPIEAEIIVVDNASNDHTKSLVSKYFPKVQYIQNHTNDGFSKANNLAIRKAKGEYICMVNPDTVLSETSITSSIHQHKSQKNCGILGVRLIDGTGNFLPESKINKLTLKVAALKMLGFSKQYYNNSLSEHEEGQTSTLVGAFMCFRKEDYQKLEGLDERYFMYGEDIDLSHQFIEAGFQNYYLGSEKIIHFKGESTLRDDVYFKRFFDSVKLFFKKHYSNSKLLIRIISTFFYLAKYFKKSDMDNREKKDVGFNSIYFFSKNSDLQSKLATHFNQEIIMMNFEESSDINFDNDLVIFDTALLSYQNIINFMSTNCSSDHLFRFTIPQIDVIIGSDSSTTQANVEFFN